MNHICANQALPPRARSSDPPALSQKSASDSSFSSTLDSNASQTTSPFDLIHQSRKRRLGDVKEANELCLKFAKVDSLDGPLESAAERSAAVHFVGALQERDPIMITSLVCFDTASTLDSHSRRDYSSRFSAFSLHISIFHERQKLHSADKKLVWRLEFLLEGEFSPKMTLLDRTVFWTFHPEISCVEISLLNLVENHFFRLVGKFFAKVRLSLASVRKVPKLSSFSKSPAQKTIVTMENAPIDQIWFTLHMLFQYKQIWVLEQSSTQIWVTKIWVLNGNLSTRWQFEYWSYLVLKFEQ